MSNAPADFVVYDERFHALLGAQPKLELLLEIEQYPFAHEAGVFIPETNELFISSNQFTDASGNKTIRISKVTLHDNFQSPRCEELERPSEAIPMANGGVNYNGSVLFCAQGSMDRPSGLYEMSVASPYESKLLIGDFYGRPYNSVNDVVIHADGSIWFTDPIYGYEQGYRPAPRLPSQVYRYDPRKGSIRAIADGFGRPNGICFSPDKNTVYITDTDWIHGDGTTDDTRPSSIYAFDISIYQGEPFLTNRRLFAMADTTIPDGIKCDLDGNVYSGCGDGINVWSPGGVLIGRILVDGGVANFCCGRRSSS
ncbi:calcium-dependent phosphotriesterase [Lipomyces doorenjongii]